MAEKINKFIDKILTFFHLIKFREQILYIIVGGLTTLVDWVIYTPCALFLPSVGGETIARISPNILAYAAGWAGSVIFAYFASRAFVFEKTGERTSTQFPKFVGARMFTLGISILGDILLCGDYAVIKVENPFLAKLFISVAVIIINYITNKLLVFSKRKKTSGGGEDVK